MKRISEIKPVISSRAIKIIDCDFLQSAPIHVEDAKSMLSAKNIPSCDAFITFIRLYAGLKYRQGCSITVGRFYDITETRVFWDEISCEYWLDVGEHQVGQFVFRMRSDGLITAENGPDNIVPIRSNIETILEFDGMQNLINKNRWVERKRALIDNRKKIEELGERWQLDVIPEATDEHILWLSSDKIAMSLSPVWDQVGLFRIFLYTSQADVGIDAIAFELSVG